MSRAARPRPNPVWLLVVVLMVGLALAGPVIIVRDRLADRLTRRRRGRHRAPQRPDGRAAAALEGAAHLRDLRLRRAPGAAGGPFLRGEHGAAHLHRGGGPDPPPERQAHRHPGRGGGAQLPDRAGRADLPDPGAAPLGLREPGLRPARGQVHRAQAAAGLGALPAVDRQRPVPDLRRHLGTTVTWTNTGQRPHTATDRGGTFDTRPIAPRGQRQGHPEHPRHLLLLLPHQPGQDERRPGRRARPRRRPGGPGPVGRPGLAAPSTPGQRQGDRPRRPRQLQLPLHRPPGPHARRPGRPGP